MEISKWMIWSETNSEKNVDIRGQTVCEADISDGNQTLMHLCIIITGNMFLCASKRRTQKDDNKHLRARQTGKMQKPRTCTRKWEEETNDSKYNPKGNRPQRVVMDKYKKISSLSWYPGPRWRSCWLKIMRLWTIAYSKTIVGQYHRHHRYVGLLTQDSQIVGPM